MKVEVKNMSRVEIDGEMNVPRVDREAVQLVMYS
jgi:hypothetical protein